MASSQRWAKWLVPGGNSVVVNGKELSRGEAVPAAGEKLEVNATRRPRNLAL